MDCVDEILYGSCTGAKGHGVEPTSCCPIWMEGSVVFSSLHKYRGRKVHRWFPLVRIALLGYGTLHAKIGFSMGKVTLEFRTICNKVFYLVGTKAYISLHHEF